MSSSSSASRFVARLGAAHRLPFFPRALPLALPLALAVAAAAAPLGTLGCAAQADDVASTGDDASGSDELRSAVFGEKHAGTTVKVKAGQSILLKLSADPSRGYAWSVTSTNRTFGYPEKEWFTEQPGAGGAGLTTFRWRTDGPFPLVGEHAVTLAYRHADADAAERQFSITFAVEDAAAPATPDELTEADDGRSVEVEEGTPVVLRLGEPEGSQWAVSSTSRTLGYPSEAKDGRARVFTFDTSGPLSKVGSHAFALERREGAEVAGTFAATLVVTAKRPAAN